MSPPSPRPEAAAVTEGWLAAEAKLPATLTVGRVAVAAVGQAGARVEAVAAETGAVVEEVEVVGAGAEAEEEGEAEEVEAVAAEEVEEVEAAGEAEVVGAGAEAEEEAEVVGGAEAELRELSPRSHRLCPRTVTRQGARLTQPPRISRRSEAAGDAAS